MRIFALELASLRSAFGAYGDHRRMVSLVGGGGKSTLMYFLGEKCARKGMRVLITTTTHIFAPNKDCYAATALEAEALWAAGKFAVIGTPVPEKGKLKAPEKSLLDALLKKADIAFVESDGSKHCPIKVPREQEPVLLPQSDLVLAVMGLSAIGKPLKDCCFGLQNAMALLDVDEDHPLTEADAAKILSSPLGGRKSVAERAFCVVLNQCDDGPRRASAERIAACLKEYGVSQVVMTAFDPAERDYFNTIAKGI